MNNFNPDAYCGINCGACSIKMFGKTGCADEFVACLKSVPKEDLAFCGGCKSDNVYAGCSICNLRHCARKKGVMHCIDCADYPCKMYSKWQSVSKFLPHAREAASSLEAIKRDGVEAWLATQKKRWSCTDCGEPFSWYAQQCNKCGRKLTSDAYKLTGWRKLLCHIVIPMAYRKGKAKKSTNALP